MNTILLFLFFFSCTFLALFLLFPAFRLVLVWLSGNDLGSA